jgi:hypothetical protein
MTRTGMGFAAGLNK